MPPGLPAGVVPGNQATTIGQAQEDRQRSNISRELEKLGF